MNTKNIFKSLKNPSSEEIFETLIKNEKIKLERIISNRQITPKGKWYDQDNNEWVMLLKGEAKIKFKKTNSTIHLKEGDYLNIDANIKHRVEYTSQDALWLALHY